MTALRLMWRVSRRRLVNDWWRVALGGVLIGAALTLSAVVISLLVDVRGRAPTLVAMVSQPAAVAPPGVPLTFGPGAVRIDGPGGRTEISVDVQSGGINAPDSVSRPSSIRVPPSWQATTGRAAALVARTTDRKMAFVATDASGALAARALPLEDGRWPTASGEIALPREVLLGLRVSKGEDLRIVGGALAGQTLRVVGSVARPDGLGTAIAVVNGSSFDRVPVAGRLVIADDPRQGFSDRSSSSAGPTTVAADGTGDLRRNGAISPAYVVRGGSVNPALIIVIQGLIYALLPLVIPLMATGSILAAGLERRSAERKLLMQAGAPGWLVRAPAAIEGIAVGVAASVVALASATLFGRSVASPWVVFGVGTLGVLAGIAASLVADGRARRLAGAAARTSGRPGPVITRALVALVVVTFGLLLLSRGGEDSGFGIPMQFVVLPVALLIIPLITTLATSLMRLLARVAPTPASRVSLGATARTRWLSAPASGLIAILSLVLLWVGAVIADEGGEQRTAVKHRSGRISPGTVRSVTRTSTCLTLRREGCRESPRRYRLRMGCLGSAHAFQSPLSYAPSPSPTAAASPRFVTRPLPPSTRSPMCSQPRRSQREPDFVRARAQPGLRSPLDRSPPGTSARSRTPPTVRG